MRDTPDHVAMFILKWVYPTALISHCLLGAIIYRCAIARLSSPQRRKLLTDSFESGVSLYRVVFDVSGESLHMPCRHGVLGIAVRSLAAYATQRVHVRSRSLGEAAPGLHSLVRCQRPRGSWRRHTDPLTDAWKPLILASFVIAGIVVLENLHPKYGLRVSPIPRLALIRAVLRSKVRD